MGLASQSPPRGYHNPQACPFDDSPSPHHMGYEVISTTYIQDLSPLRFNEPGNRSSLLKHIQISYNKHSKGREIQGETWWAWRSGLPWRALDTVP